MYKTSINKMADVATSKGCLFMSPTLGVKVSGILYKFTTVGVPYCLVGIIYLKKEYK